MLPSPTDYRRRVLLAVAGLSPQVVTETVWALAQADPGLLPTELHLLTTAEGARRAALLLVGTEDEAGALAALAADLGIALPPLTLHVLRDPDGAALGDVASAEDNQAIGDCIAELLRGFTADPDAAVHLSIAGGRKTMGLFAGMALSLFGRPQDRMSHVLVAPAFQAHPQFFFPPRRPRVLIAMDGGPVSTADARVVLADIPFVRLRQGLRVEELDRPGGYAAAVAAAQRQLAPPRLVLDLPAGRAVFGELAVPLPPALLGALLWFAQRRTEGDGSASWRGACQDEWIAAMAAAAGSTAAPAVEAARRAVAGGLTAELLAEKKARLNKVVARALGPAAAPYRIEAVGRRPHTRYRLTTPPEAITVRHQDAAR